MSGRLILAIPLFSLSVLTGAQTMEERERIIDSLSHPAVSETAAAVMKFEDTVIDAGVILEDGEAPEYEFVWTNIGDRTVCVTNVTTTCGCVQASFDRTPTVPGEKSSLKVRYYPKGHPGKFDRRIFVYTDMSGSRPAVILSLKGDVTPAKVPVWAYRYRMGALLLKQKEVKFTTGRLAVERILCQNAGDEDIVIGAVTELLPPYISFRCEPQRIEPGEKAELVIRYDPEAVPARMLNEVPIILTGLNLPPSQRTIKAKFEEPVRWRP